MLKKKLEASALFYALIVAVLMALVSTAMISTAYYHRLIINQGYVQEKLIRNAASAWTLILLDKRDDIPTTTMDLYKRQTDSVQITKKRWGLFEIAISQAFQQSIKGREQITKIGLLGVPPDKVDQAALYLQDNRKPLSVSGQTQIIGDAFLPKAGVKSAYVNQQAYEGTALIYGDQLRSQRILPAIESETVQYHQAQFKHSSKSSFYDLGDSTEQSFLAETRYYRDKIIRIDEQYIKGNICLIADSLIYVGRNTVVEDVLLYAPVIVIEAGFVGQLQAFAQRKITVGSYADLQYPSVMALLKPSSTYTSPHIDVQEHAHIHGLVLSYQQKNDNYPPLVNIAKEALIKGQLFIHGTLDLKGTVHGHVTCSNFLLKTSSTTYDNHLFDATINVEQRHSFYLSPIFKTKKGKRKVVKWLDG